VRFKTKGKENHMKPTPDEIAKAQASIVWQEVYVRTLSIEEANLEARRQWRETFDKEWTNRNVSINDIKVENC
jgi:hypothetical protein